MLFAVIFKGNEQARLVLTIHQQAFFGLCLPCGLGGGVRILLNDPDFVYSIVVILSHFTFMPVFQKKRVERQAGTHLAQPQQAFDKQAVPGP